MSWSIAGKKRSILRLEHIRREQAVNIFLRARVDPRGRLTAVAAAEGAPSAIALIFRPMVAPVAVHLIEDPDRDAGAAQAAGRARPRPDYRLRVQC